MKIEKAGDKVKDINSKIDSATSAITKYEKMMEDLLAKIVEKYCYDSSEDFIASRSDEDINWQDSAKYDCLEKIILYQDILVSDLKKIKDGSEVSLSGIRADVKKIITEWESSVTDIEDNIQKMKSILLICDEVEGVTN